MKQSKFKLTDKFIQELLWQARLELEITAELIVVNSGYAVYAILTIKHADDTAQSYVNLSTYENLSDTAVALVEELYLKS